MEYIKLVATEYKGDIYEMYPDEIKTVDESLLDLGFIYQGYKKTNKSGSLNSLVWTRPANLGKEEQVDVYDNGSHPTGFYISTGSTALSRELVGKLKSKLECSAVKWKGTPQVKVVCP